MKSRSLFRIAIVMALLLGQWLGAPVRAAEVGGLFQSAVAVESREDERQRVRAFSQALREVLVKLTGHADVNDDPVIQNALRSPQSYVESWAYRTQILPGTTEQHLTIEIIFYRAEIERLLDSAGIALWPATRPETLVWVVVQNEAGERAFVDPYSGVDTKLLDDLALEAAKRGVPLTTPLFDFEDQRLLRPDQLWALDVEALKLVSARYPFESIIGMRVLRTVSGDVVAKSVHLFRDRVLENEVLEGALPDFLSSTVGMVARELADNYGVRLTAPSVDGGERMLLSVEGVQGLADYAAVLAYLGKVPGISGLQVREANADHLIFAFSAAGQVRQLVENLSLQPRLAALAAPVREEAGFMLRYRWQAN